MSTVSGSSIKIAGGVSTAPSVGGNSGTFGVYTVPPGYYGVFNVRCVATANGVAYFGGGGVSTHATVYLNINGVLIASAVGPEVYSGSVAEIPLQQGIYVGPSQTIYISWSGGITGGSAQIFLQGVLFSN